MASFKSKLEAIVAKNNSLVCVGLDPVLEKLPKKIAKAKRPFFEFNKAIVDATAEAVCAYKPNVAFYEALGSQGVKQLELTCDYITSKYPNVPLIIDAKRGDIGNTNQAYTKAVFEILGADAVTVSPYLGREDAMQVFLDHEDKGIFVLCRTSNPGAVELQDLKVDGGDELYKVVAKKAATEWNAKHNCHLVVAATYPDEMAEIRKIVGNRMWFLTPGSGAQGGNLEKTLVAGLTGSKDGLIINQSREIIYASDGVDFAAASLTKTLQLRDQINLFRRQ